MVILFLAWPIIPAAAQSPFEAPPKPFPSTVSPPKDVQGLIYRTITFPSAIQSAEPKNNTVNAILIEPKDIVGRPPVVIMLHGLGVVNHDVERRIAYRMARNGIASLLVTLPYHIERTPEGKQSGTMMLRTDVASIRMNIIQTVSDVRRAIDWLDTTELVDAKKVGVLGVSLGAILACVAASIDPRIEYSALLLAGGDLAHIIWSSSLTIPLRDDLRKNGWTEVRLRQAIQDVDPLPYATPQQGLNTFLVGALFDTIIPEQDTEKLHKALGSPPMLWLETNHYGSALVEQRVFRLAADFFEARFSGRDWIPPASIHAPTIRLGLTLDSGEKLQIAAALDLWRSNRQGEFFAAGLLSPRGLALFTGWRGPLGVAAGLIAYPKRTVPGILWHFIL